MPVPLLSILVPVRDEAENLHALHERLLAVQSSLSCETEIVYLENGSTDASLSILLSLPGAAVLSLEDSRGGQAAAIAMGADYAHGDLLATIDADLQTDPADFPRLLEALADGSDAAIGQRRQLAARPVMRFVSYAGNLLRRLAGFRGCRDAGCGLRLWKKGSVEEGMLTKGMHRFFPDLLALRGRRVVQVWITNVPRMRGRSKYNWTKCFGATGDLLTLAVFRSFERRSLPFLRTVRYGMLLCAFLFSAALLYAARFGAVGTFTALVGIGWTALLLATWLLLRRMTLTIASWLQPRVPAYRIEKSA